MSFLLLISKIRNHLQQVIKVISDASKQKIYPDYCFALHDNTNYAVKQSPSSILETIIGDGFLWAVPKRRRSLEKRMTRRMAFGKMLLPQKNIVVCESCGHFHPVHTVCGNCYQKIKEETTLMQETVLKELKLDPIEKEVIVLYKDDLEKNLFEGRHIVELPKERPPWFTKNLLVKDSEIARKKSTSLGNPEISAKIDNSN